MAQYINKDALVEEIGRLKAESLQKKSQCKRSGLERMMHQIGAYNKILSFLDTLEVKEVDIEDSIKETLAQKYIDYTFRRHNIDPESKEGQLIYYAYIHGMNQCLTQLRTQKKE